MICNNCGSTIINNHCPICNDELIKLNNDKLDVLFKEEKLKIEFNLKNILNDVDYRNEYENVSIKEAEDSKQYHGHDLSERNEQNISSINKFYNRSIEQYIKKQKCNLELMDINMLQAHVASFNDVVNNCDKFKKMSTNKNNQILLRNTIKKYNDEIHYIKKYFILPLYDIDNIFNKSRLAKNLFTIISIFLMYFIFCKTPLFDMFYHFIHIFTGSYTDEIPEIAKLHNCMAMVSAVSSIGISELMFQFYIKYEVHNNNFQVDKNKNYEIHLAVILLGYVVACLIPFFAYVYNWLLILYMLFFCINSLVVKKWDVGAIIVKASMFLMTIIVAIFNFF